MVRRGFCVALLLALGIGVAACGSDSSGSEETPGGEASVVPVGTRLPLDQPTVTGSTVNFPAKGYSMEIPAGWEFESNAVRSDELTPDFVIFPEEIDGVQANIILSCEVLRGEAAAITLDQFFDNKAARAQDVGATEIVEGPGASIGGVEARLLEYKRVVGGIAIVRRDLLFLHDDCAWQIAYTAAPSTVARFQPDVDALIRSFTLDPS